MPIALSTAGVVLYRAAEMLLGTPVKRRSDKEIRLWNAGSFATLGLLSFFNWKALLAEDAVPYFKVFSGVLGTLTGIGALLALLSTVLPGPFVRSKSDITLVMSRGVPKVVFKGKGA